jgi:tRNA (guanine37-N1)-methyltransferase
MMRINVLTIFPEYFEAVTRDGMLRIAADKGLAEVKATDIRLFTDDAHRTVDDYSFGGGPGMVMKPEPIYRALSEVLGGDPEQEREKPGTRVVITTPRGRRLNQALASELSSTERLVIICGHYEGVDERIHELATDEISIGDYVLSGGEAAAAVIIDAAVRLIPGVLGSADSLSEESFENGLLEYPQYTRPREFLGKVVPDVLLSGNHGRISRWRREQAIAATKARRPDLLEGETDNDGKDSSF